MGRIDATTPEGKQVFCVFGAVAESERGMIRERTMARLEAARGRSCQGGRTRAGRKEDLARYQLMRDRETSIGEISKQ